MAAGLVVQILFDFALILLVAKLFGELAERLRQPAVLGELFGGLLIGPGLLLLIPATLGVADPTPRQEILLFLGELGAIILLFEVGLETNLGSILKVGRAATVVALLGIVGSVALGFGVSWGLGVWHLFPGWPNDPIFHLFIGATFSATSVGITARVLKDMGRLNTNDARIILGAAVLDDVGALLILAIVSGIIVTGSVDPTAIAIVAAKAFGFLLVAVAVGVKLVPPLFTRLGALRVRGMVVSSAFILALALAAGAALVGLHSIVGAFAAGMVLAQTREQHAIVHGISPLGIVFIPFFFVLMGSAINLRVLGTDAAAILGVTAVLFVVAVLAKLLCAFGVRKGEASRAVVGFGMVPRGEVGLIFVGVGIATLNLEDWESAALILTVMLTTVVVPPILRHLYKGQPLLPDPADEAAESAAEIGDR